MQQNIQFNAVFDPDKKNNPQAADFNSANQMKVIPQSLISRPPIAAGSASNAAAAIAYQ